MDIPENNFGKLSSKYKLARRGYPVGVYEYLKYLVKNENSIALDLGCGTGISTRELKTQGFEVIGVDKDVAMIKEAQGEQDDINYIVAPANKLPFSDDHFDLVTAFTAFHWFNDLESILEIKRVLKSGGLFFAALKGNQETIETENFNKEYFSILEKYAGSNFDNTYKHFDKKYLEKVFGEIIGKSFPFEEKYTIEDSLILLQSLSFWNVVPENQKQNMLDEMHSFYTKHLVNGFVVRKREIFTIAVWKR